MIEVKENPMTSSCLGREAKVAASLSSVILVADIEPAFRVLYHSYHIGIILLRYSMKARRVVL